MRLYAFLIIVPMFGGCDAIYGKNSVFQVTLDFSDLQVEGEKRVNVVYSFIDKTASNSTNDTIFENVLIDDALSLTSAGIEFDGQRRKKLVLDFLTDSDAIFAKRDLELRVLFCDSSENCNDNNAAISRYTFRIATPFYAKSCTAYRFAKLPSAIPAVDDEAASYRSIGKCFVAGCIGVAELTDSPLFCGDPDPETGKAQHKCETNPSCFTELFDESEF